MLVFDNGRLKQATYDTAQGFGLRAVKDEAVGYAHASDVSEAALIRAADAVRAVKGGHTGSYAEAPPRSNVRLYGDENPLGAPELRGQGPSARDHRRLCARQGSARAASLGQPRGLLAGGRDPARRTARSIATCGRWCGSMFRWWPATATVRRPAATAMAAAKAMRASSSPAPGRARSTRPCVRRWSIWNRCPRPAGEMDVVLGAGWPGVMLHEAVGHGLEGDFNRKKTSAFAGLMGQRVAAKGVTVVDDGTTQCAARLAVDRRRRHADQQDRADRGRHPGRLHAGPAERAADGHAADRQRPARELRPCADAAHDQHLYAGRRARSGRDHRVGARTASTR